MVIAYQVKLPKRDPFPKIKLQRVMTLFRQFGTDTLQHLKTYPPKPPASRYRRSGDLSRGWNSGGGVKMRGGDLVIEFDNFAIDLYGRKYWVWVQGPRRGAGPKQRRIMATYGWSSISDVRTKIWPRYRPRIMKSLGVTRGVGEIRPEFTPEFI